MANITVRGSWYEYGSDYVVVLTGMPEDAVQVGIGPTPHQAWESLEGTPIQSTGAHSGEPSALAYAHSAGWIDDIDDLEEADDSIGAQITEPLGDVDWEKGDTYEYVACLYGNDGSQPGDCRVRVGEDSAGVWWLDDGDDDYSETSGPYNDREAAEAAAEKLAESQHEGEEDEDADAMEARLLDERAGEPDPEGDWCVYWETVCDDAHVVDRYASKDAAEAAAERAQAGLVARNPGPLLCGYEVRCLVEGNWEPVEGF